MSTSFPVTWSPYTKPYWKCRANPCENRQRPPKSSTGIRKLPLTYSDWQLCQVSVQSCPFALPVSPPFPPRLHGYAEPPRQLSMVVPIGIPQTARSTRWMVPMGRACLLTLPLRHYLQAVRSCTEPCDSRMIQVHVAFEGTPI